MSEFQGIGGINQDDADDISGTIDSMPPIRIGELDSEHGVVLKDWTAQDFARIYVRFRPYLISHARKFLREESQAEEVVQDAFLYLMTALPELDSELGVLRFLKWKTKMLCFDLIRSSGSLPGATAVSLPEDFADDTQPSDSLEIADDAALVRLALAKLTVRHREALVATIYEEKSYEEVAQQMGVGLNAFRQLLFRARASFRQRLTEEAGERGIPVNSLFARSENSSGRLPSRLIGSFSILLVAAGLFVSVGFTPQDNNNYQALMPEVLSNTESKVAEMVPEESGDGGETGDSARLTDPGTDSLLVGSQVSDSSDSKGEQSFAVANDTLDDGDVKARSSFVADSLEKFEVAVHGWASRVLTDLVASPEQSAFVIEDNVVVLEVGTSATLSLILDDSGQDLGVGVAYLSGTDGEKGFVAIPTGTYLESRESADSGWEIVSLVLTGFAVGDLGGTYSSDVLDNTHFAEIAIQVEMELNRGEWNVRNGRARFIPRT